MKLLQSQVGLLIVSVSLVNVKIKKTNNNTNSCLVSSHTDELSMCVGGKDKGKYKEKEDKRMKVMIKENERKKVKSLKLGKKKQN